MEIWTEHLDPLDVVGSENRMDKQIWTSLNWCISLVMSFNKKIKESVPSLIFLFKMCRKWFFISASHLWENLREVFHINRIPVYLFVLWVSSVIRGSDWEQHDVTPRGFLERQGDGDATSLSSQVRLHAINWARHGGGETWGIVDTSEWDKFK